MAVFSFPAVAIFDSTATGRSLITAADQAAARAAIGIDPSDYGLLDSDNTWTGDNTFTQTLTTNQIQNSLGSEGIKFDANYGYLTNANGASNVLRWGSNGFEPYQIFKPRYDETIDFGATNRRWLNSYFVNGDFKTSVRVYNLGETGDVNSEYLETSWVGNVATIEAKATGTGAVRTINLKSAGFRFYAGGAMVLATAAGYTIDSYWNIVPQNPSRYLGTTTKPWANVVSVDGNFSGTISAADGSVTAPSYSFNSQSTMGIYRAATNQINMIAATGGKGFNLQNTSISISSDMAFGWRSVQNISQGHSFDTLLARDATGIIAQRNFFADAPQAFRVYGTWTDASNGAWLQMDYGVTNAGAATIQAYANGTGANGGLYLRSETSLRLYVGNILAQNLSSTVDRFNVHIEPYFDNQKRAGSSTKRFTEVWSYDADFSGTLTTNLIQGGQSLLKLNESANQFLNIWNAAGSTQYYSFRNNSFLPKVSSIKLGLPVSTARWLEVHAVAGSYEELNVETGGSFKFYNLGDSHTNTTNTESMSLYSTSNVNYFYSAATGSGTVRDLRIGSASNNIWFRNAFGAYIFTAGGSGKLEITSAGVILQSDLFPWPDGTEVCGKTDHRWLSVNSVDGDFSGTVTASDGVIVDSGRYVGLGYSATKMSFATTSALLQVGTNTIFNAFTTQVQFYKHILPNNAGTAACGIVAKPWSEVWQGEANVRGSYVDGSNYGHLSIEPLGDDYLIKANSLGTTADASIKIQTSQLSAAGSQSVILDADYNGVVSFYFGGNNRGYWGKSILQANVQVATNTNFVINRTWNNAATVFQGFDANITDTASDANSNLLNLKVSGVQKFRVKKDGTCTATAFVGDGSGLTNLPAATVDTGDDYTWTGANTFEENIVMESNVDFTGLPTTDPNTAGRLYNDSGTLKISSGGPPPP